MVFCGVVYDCVRTCGNIYGFKPRISCDKPRCFVLRAAPTVAVILILYAFYSNETLAFVVGFLIAFPILFTAIYSALSGVDKDLIEMTKIYKVKKSTS